jgi:hypothetical protein
LKHRELDSVRLVLAPWRRRLVRRQPPWPSGEGLVVQSRRRRAVISGANLGESELAQLFRLGRLDRLWPRSSGCLAANELWVLIESYRCNHPTVGSARDAQRQSELSYGSVTQALREKGSAQKIPPRKSLHRSAQYYSNPKRIGLYCIGRIYRRRRGPSLRRISRRRYVRRRPAPNRRSPAQPYQQPRLGNRRLFGKYGRSSS